MGHPPDDRLDSSSGVVYDAAGNVTSDTLTGGLTNTYTYDAENRVVALGGTNATAVYQYDAFGHRIYAKVNAGAPMNYFYDLAGHAVDALNSSALQWEQVYLGNTPLAIYENATTYFYHGDQVGSLRELTDPTGVGVGTCKNLSFGDGQSCTTTLSPFQFTGQLLDTESNLTHLPFRQLSTTQGRWTTPDPAGMAAADITNPQSWNRYAYVMNNPLSLIDPTGLVDDCGGPCTPFTFQQGGCTVNVTYSTVTGSDGQSYDSPNFQTLCPPRPRDEYPFMPSDHAGAGGNGNAANNKNCPAQSSTGPNTIWSLSLTTSYFTEDLGEAVGGLFGPEGAVAGAAIGKQFGVGLNISYVPSTKSLFAGPTAVYSPTGGTGVSLNFVAAPGQNPNSIANGLSFSLTFQPNPVQGATVTYSPGNGPPVQGPSFGTRTPISPSVSYNHCVGKCGC